MDKLLFSETLIPREEYEEQLREKNLLLSNSDFDAKISNYLSNFIKKNR